MENLWCSLEEKMPSHDNPGSERWFYGQISIRSVRTRVTSREHFPMTILGCATLPTQLRWHSSSSSHPPRRTYPKSGIWTEWYLSSRERKRMILRYHNNLFPYSAVLRRLQTHQTRRSWLRVHQQTWSAQTVIRGNWGLRDMPSYSREYRSVHVWGSCERVGRYGRICIQPDRHHREGRVILTPIP